jgi:hypothetical protein
MKPEDVQIIADNDVDHDLAREALERKVGGLVGLAREKGVGIITYCVDGATDLLLVYLDRESQRKYGRAAERQSDHLIFVMHEDSAAGRRVFAVGPENIPWFTRKE